MSVKKYISSSLVSISVVLPSGKSMRVVFFPLTGRGSYYLANNEDVQKAIERHKRFGSLFKLDTTYGEEKPEVKPAMDVKIENEVTEVKVSCLDDAKEYLSDRFGVSRTKLRSTKAIEDAASAHNIVFVGL